MKTIRTAVLVIIALSIITIYPACKKSSSDSQPGTDKKEYKGTASVSVKYYEYNAISGQDVFVEEKQYSYPVFVFVNPPMQSGGIDESNPFNLQVYPDRDTSIDEEGHIDISSAQIFAVSTGYVLLQYWNISLNGEQVSGTLQDNHTAEASAANLVWAWEDVAGIVMTMPFAIANGATLTGMINQNSTSLTISGQSVDTYRKFTCMINSSRFNDRARMTRINQ